MENLHIPNSTYIFCPALTCLPYFVGSLFGTLLELWGYTVTDDSGKPYTLSPPVCKGSNPTKIIEPFSEWMVSKTKSDFDHYFILLGLILHSFTFLL